MRTLGSDDIQKSYLYYTGLKPTPPNASIKMKLRTGERTYLCRIWNFTSIGSVCRSCAAKKTKIDRWVKAVLTGNCLADKLCMHMQHLYIGLNVPYQVWDNVTCVPDELRVADCHFDYCHQYHHHRHHPQRRLCHLDTSFSIRIQL